MSLVLEHVGREVLELRLAEECDADGLLAALDGRVDGHDLAEDLLMLYTSDAEALLAEIDHNQYPHDSALVARRRSKTSSCGSPEGASESECDAGGCLRGPRPARGPPRPDSLAAPRGCGVDAQRARVLEAVEGVLLPQFLDPLFYLVALGFGLGTYVARINGVPYEDFIAPGLIASAAMWSAAFETTYNVYLRMNETRLYDAVLATPVEVQDLVAGDLAWSASRAAVYGTSFWSSSRCSGWSARRGRS